MSKIQVNHLSYGYPGSQKLVFEDVSFSIDTNWKLGLIGRNGAGKTTFLNLLLGKDTYQGSIHTDISFQYFPYPVKNKEDSIEQLIEQIEPEGELWKIQRELQLLELPEQILKRKYIHLSGGEQVKVMLAILFAKEDSFLLLDEPTNHLDENSKSVVQTYLSKKKGFIVVSHDRELLDKTVDHILAIHRTNIEICKGNFSVWKENKDRKEHEEWVQNETLKKDIVRLEQASKSVSTWSDKVEKTKCGTRNAGLRPDRGHIGHQSAKMMKRAKAIERRYEKEVEQKESLLQNVEKKEELVMKPLVYSRPKLATIYQLAIAYREKPIVEQVTFTIERGDRIAVTGKNGAGKSSLLKLLWGQDIPHTGVCEVQKDLKISYVSQSTEDLKGDLKTFARENQMEESIFKAMLSKLGVTASEFEKDISSYSEGQKKKVLLAKSMTESADLYIWDEPFNYIDILSRIQIEEMLLKYQPTMIFVEHDKTFIGHVANKQILL